MQCDAATGKRGRAQEDLLQVRSAALWDLFQQLGEKGTRWQEYVSLPPLDAAAFQQIFFEDVKAVPSSSLGHYLSVWKRWVARATAGHRDPTSPTTMGMVLWLRHAAAGGPTAARGLLSACRWLQDFVGIDFKAHAPALRLRAAPPGDHEPRAATPLSLGLWLHWEAMLGEANPFIRWVAATWLLLLLGVLRFAHLQRSFDWQYTPAGIFARVSIGKARKMGRRAPFRWCCPRHSLRGDLGATLQDLQAGHGSTEAAWLLPDFLPITADISSVHACADRPMLLQRFHRISRQLLSEPPAGLSVEHAAAVSSYSARRVLPTVADLAGYSTNDRVKLGGWLDAESRGLAVRARIPDIYSDAKIVAALTVKQSVLDTVNGIMAAHPRTVLDAECSQFSSHLMQASSSWRSGSTSASSGGPFPGLASAPLVIHGPRGQDLLQGATMDDAPWVRSVAHGAKLHWNVQHLGKDPIPFCGRLLVDVLSGKGSRDKAARGREWSPRCRAAYEAHSARATL